MLELLPSTANCEVSPDMEEIHRRCGVYTRREVVIRLLDSIGWKADANLAEARLLEPATGDGMFIGEATSRLLKSLSRGKRRPNKKQLIDRIVAFEIHPVEARRARKRVREVLKSCGMKPADAATIARSWVRTTDFLLAEIAEESFSHVAGNPPYARWSKIPPKLRSQYEVRLPQAVARGDLFLPFLDLSIGYLRKGGRLGFVCSDRWRYMAFADGFRTTRLPEVVIEKETPVEADTAYQRSVDAYPSLLVMRKRQRAGKRKSALRPSRRMTLVEAGYRVRVGPALGCTRAFVLDPEDDRVEPELTLPWLDASEVGEGEIRWSGRQVIAMNAPDGKLRDLGNFRLAKARLERFRLELEKRSIVRAGATWYRPIDRIRASDWSRPKLLIPELAKIPRVAPDTSGAIPSHGVYAIFAPNNDLEALLAQLANGGLARLSILRPRDLSTRSLVALSRLS
jgi:adenine-specific DNA-methyltransferase